MSKRDNNQNPADPSHYSNNPPNVDKPAVSEPNPPSKSLMSRVASVFSSKKSKESPPSNTPSPQPNKMDPAINPTLSVSSQPTSPGVSFMADKDETTPSTQPPQPSEEKVAVYTPADRLERPVVLTPDIYDQNEYHFRHSTTKPQLSIQQTKSPSKSSSSGEEDLDDLYRRLINIIPSIVHIQVPVPDFLPILRSRLAEHRKNQGREQIQKLLKKIQVLKDYLDGVEKILGQYAHLSDENQLDDHLQSYIDAGITLNVFDQLYAAYEKHMSCSITLINVKAGRVPKTITLEPSMIEKCMRDPGIFYTAGYLLVGPDDLEQIRDIFQESLRQYDDEISAIEAEVLNYKPSYRDITASGINDMLNRYPTSNKIERFPFTYYPMIDDKPSRHGDHSNGNEHQSDVKNQLALHGVPMHLLFAQQSSGLGIFFTPDIDNYSFSNQISIEFVEDGPCHPVNILQNVEKGIRFYNGDTSVDPMLDDDDNGDHSHESNDFTIIDGDNCKDDTDVPSNLDNTHGADVVHMKDENSPMNLTNPPAPGAGAAPLASLNPFSTPDDVTASETEKQHQPVEPQAYDKWFNSPRTYSRDYDKTPKWFPPTIISTPEGAKKGGDSGTRYLGVIQTHMQPHMRELRQHNLEFFHNMVQHLDDDAEVITLRLYFDHSYELLKSAIIAHYNSSAQFSGLCGLVNQAATCYMNSYLQSLFHIPLFRKTLYYIPNTEVPKICHVSQITTTTSTTTAGEGPTIHSHDDMKRSDTLIIDNHTDGVISTTSLDALHITPSLEHSQLNSDIVLDHDQLLADVENNEKWVNPFDIYKQVDPQFCSKHEISFRQYLYNRGVVGRNNIVSDDNDGKDTPGTTTTITTTVSTTDKNDGKTEQKNLPVVLTSENVVNRTTTTITTSLQQLFYQMQIQGKIRPHHAYEQTVDLTTSFGWHRHEVYEQQDIQEFARKLMDSLEKSMYNTVVENATARLFQGQIENVIECINIDYTRVRQETFEDIMLQVIGCPTLHDSFKQYCEIETLEGDNQYRTDNHGKQDVRKYIRLTRKLPPILTLVLKRMEFDKEVFELRKVNDYMEFPLELNMADYVHQDSSPSSSSQPSDTTEKQQSANDDILSSQNHLPQQHAVQREQDLVMHGVNLPAYRDALFVDQSIQCPVHGDPSLMYDLCAVVVHMGHLDRGHYISYVRPLLPSDASQLPPHNSDVDMAADIDDATKQELDEILVQAQAERAQARDSGCICPFDHARALQYRQHAKWYRCDDDVVTECSKEEAVDQNYGDKSHRSLVGKSAYMLFYLRRQYTYYDEETNNGDEIIFHPAALTTTGRERIPGYVASDVIRQQHQLLVEKAKRQSKNDWIVVGGSDENDTNEGEKPTSQTSFDSEKSNDGDHETVANSIDLHRLVQRQVYALSKKSPHIKKQLEIKPPLALLRTLNEVRQQKRERREKASRQKQQRQVQQRYPY